MSLVIKKFADGGSPEVRTYKRGNDEVDLNAFVRQAEAGFDNWLDKANIKKKYKKEVRAAYQDMITRINDDPESFIARLGGGFTNTAGITNNKNGFDAYGIAAGYLGNTLRSMQVYTKPKVKSNKSKYKRDAGLITQKMQSQILGDDANSFIKLDDDSYDENTGQRGLTNRITQTIAGLSALKGRLKDYYDFDSDEDYNHAIGRIDSAIAHLQNTNPNDDWFTLGQLGMTGMDRFFTIGKERSTTPRSSEEQSHYASRNFEDWMSSNRPFYTGQLATAIPIGTQVGTANEQQKTELRNRLGSLSRDDIRDWLLSYIVNPNYDFSQYPTLRRMYGGSPISGLFTNAQYISGVLEQAAKMGELKNISGTNTYYIPSTLETYADNSSTVYVYDADSHTFHQVDTQDIADYRKQYLDEYRKSNPSSYSGSSAYMSRYPEMYPSHKEGGILKFDDGGWFRKIWTQQALGDWNEQLDSSAWKNNTTFHGSAMNLESVARANAAYTSDPKNIAADLNSYYQTTPEDIQNQAFVDLYNSKINALNKFFDNNVSYLTTDAASHNQIHKELYSSRNAEVGTNPDFNLTYDPRLIKKAGSTTWHRRADRYEKKFADLTPEERANRIHTISRVVQTPNGPQVKTFQVYKENDGTIGLFNPDLQNVRDQIHEEIMNEVRTNPELGEISQNTQSDNPKFELDEKSVNTKSPKDNSKIVNTLGELGANLMGIGRLMGSIRTNNRIARIVRESRKPKLHNTPEFYFPVTGAATEMQLRDEQGNKILSQSYRPFTSDASLAAARMLEGQRHANDLQYQGFIADDREIKRTQAEALKRQEDNIARRSKLANDNMDAIIENNQILAQLEASRLKQNWTSIDNYLQGVENSTRQRIAENRKRRNQFALQAGQLSAEQERKRRINEVMDYYRAYKNKPGNENKTLSDFNYATQGQYEQAIAAINAAYQRDLLSVSADVYGYNYPTPKGYSPYDISKYNLTVAKHGGVLKPSQLIDKIIRKNEGNT